MPHGVGIVGAGPGVAALHLPTLARLSDDFEVVHIADGGSGRAEDLAARVGGRSSSGIAELLADPAVEVVVLASPPAEHAEPDPRGSRRRQACDPVREAPRDDPRRCRRGDRRVPSRRHGAADRHQPSLRPGLGPREASSARRRAQGARDHGHAGPPAEWPLPRRRHRAVGACRSTRARRPAPRCAAGRGIRRPSADHGTRRARTADAARPRADDRASRVRARDRPDRLRPGLSRIGDSGADGHRHAARRRRRVMEPRDHHRHRRARRCRSRLPLCTSAAPRCAW